MRSSSAIATSRWAWPRPIGEEMYSARLRRALPRAQRGRAGGGDDELADQQVDPDRVAHVRAVAGALEQDQIAAGRLGERVPRPGPGSRPVPWITSTGQRTRPHSSRAVCLVEAVADPVATSVSAVVSSAQPTQSSIGLVECGSVNIWEKKNSRKPR